MKIRFRKMPVGSLVKGIRMNIVNGRSFEIISKG